MYRAICGIATILLLWRAGHATATPPMTPEQLEFFEKKVRPVLAENCFSCHGSEKQHSGLRLDSHAAVLKGGDGGPVVVPGKPEESPLISAIKYESYEMPPKGKLADPVIEALEAWVKMGAPWPKDQPGKQGEESVASKRSHWSFQPIRNPELPAVRQQEWIRDPIDHFVLARLEERGLKPSPIADKRTLIRRATLDLTGVPPTREEVEAFMADDTPDAFAKVVGRLLDSPRYGERWGRHWLDVARYADTKGYVFTQERRYPYSYTYRDYVINSFNEDLPIDQFIVEQLAADLLPDNRDGKALAAMGFLTVGRRFLNNIHDIIDDRIDVATRGLMGLTVVCARCHDHKFDPVPTEDYYSLYGIFASSHEPAELPKLPNTAPPETVAAFEAEKAKIEKQRDDYVTAKQTEYRDKFTKEFAQFLEAAYAMDFNPRHGKGEELAKKLGVEQRMLGAFVERFKQQMNARNKPEDPIFGAWHAFSKLPADQFASKAPETADQLRQENSPLDARIAQFVLESAPENMTQVVANYGKAFAAAAASNDAGDALRQFVDAVVELPTNEVVAVFNRAERDAYNKFTAQIEGLEASHPGAPPRAMVMNDNENPYNPYVFVRGTPGRRGKSVPRRFLEVLSNKQRPTFDKGSGRLELAKRIVADDNPLTARVFVNRVWGHHFGLAIVRTPSDFGLQGEPPTHPELLDHLAWTFRADGWSLKRLHRRIMLSSTYQQSSDIRPDGQQMDPENRLIWRQNRQRLEFEPMRDSLLFVAANLDESKGGRSVDITSDNYSNRRAVYGFIDRQNLDGLFRTFDLASPNASSPKRFVTTVPQQALFLMNSNFLADQARRVAERTDAESKQERVENLYALLFGRAPDAEEMSLALSFLDNEEESVAVAPGWHYGYGRLDPSAGALASYKPLEKWTDNRWQFADQYPHPQAGHLVLHSGGGHPGPNDDYSTVLRWVTPCNGTVRVLGLLRHKNKEGDGVKGVIVSSRSGKLGEWVAHNGTAKTSVPAFEVAAGETIDFVVAPQATSSFDSYEWSPVVKIEHANEEVAKKTWNGKSDFHGPIPPKPNAWQQYVQALLMSNEFCFAD